MAPPLFFERPPAFHPPRRARRGTRSRELPEEARAPEYRPTCRKAAAGAGESPREIPRAKGGIIMAKKTAKGGAKKKGGKKR